MESTCKNCGMVYEGELPEGMICFCRANEFEVQ